MNNIEINQKLPDLVLPPITRYTLALFCGASGDHNPIHVDSDFAKEAGVGDVFAHGMLSMAYLARLLTGWVRQDKIKSYGVRFAAITHVHDVITCTGVVEDIVDIDGKRIAKLNIKATNQQGVDTLVGAAEVYV